MNIGIYSPYLHSLSGGERYMLTLAGHWSGRHTVTLFWDDPTIVSLARDRLGLSLDNIRLKPNIFSRGNLAEKLRVTSTFDCIVFLSDGSIPTSFARRNILHFQVPFPKVSVPFWKRLMYRFVVCNSAFTWQHIDPRVGQNAIVIYPPVDAGAPPKGKKENLVLSVGRFTSDHTAKKQEILIRTFKLGRFKGWRLILAGGLLPSDEKYFQELKKTAGKADIELLPNVNHDTIHELYQKASIYWHAAGYGETDPMYAEHFGITTVEAMGAGCIPVVFNGGGQPEIVRHGSNGFLWSTPEQLLNYTMRAMNNGGAGMRKKARDTALTFNLERFTAAFDRLLV